MSHDRPLRDQPLTPQLVAQGSLQRMVQPPQRDERLKAMLLWSALVGGIVISLLAA